MTDAPTQPPSSEPDDLDALLERARDAEPLARIELRDPIAAHGEQAIEAMTDWLGDPRLAAFAIRVLERIGRTEANRASVMESLRAVDRDELPAHLVRDVEAALGSLGINPRRPPGRRTGAPRTGAARAVGLPGVEGRDYWVMRTSPWERPFVWAEAQRGRLRQGWGWVDSQDLEVIAETVRRGGDLTDNQRLAWRSRRMRTTAPDGMRLGDIVVAANLPEWGRLSIFRVTGSYRWEPVDLGILEQFGHVLPVELLVEGVDRRAPVVSDALRAMLRPHTRLYNIGSVGGEVEAVIAAGATNLSR